MIIVVLPIKYNIKKEEKKIDWFDEDDIKKFIVEATRINTKTKNYVYRNGFIIASNIFLGLRIGELLALQWKDIDLEKNRISITKTTTQIENPNYNPNDKNSVKNLIIIQDTTKTEVKVVNSNSNIDDGEINVNSVFYVILLGSLTLFHQIMWV